MCSTRNCKPPELVISGIGVTSAVGQGKAAFTEALMEGRHAFGIMRRPGRQKGTSFLGAEIASFNYPATLSKKVLRMASHSGQAALVTLDEAWREAKLDQVDPLRIGLVIGGSNLQQREMVQNWERYAERPEFIRPSYGLSFMDSDLCGLCTEGFGIQGMALTVGGASASGQVAIIQAAQAVTSGQVDVCIALGALMDLSYLECQALRSLGAMGSDRYADQPALACRPFDRNHDGFIYGECCGAVVVERAASARERSLDPYAHLAGWGIKMDQNRNPDPSYQGEVHVIRQALERAGVAPSEVDYVNPHGTGSLIGDETELRAIRDCGLSHVWLNTTKSIVGHGLTAAGTVEAVATALQMRQERLHGSRNLEEPIDPTLKWVAGEPVSHRSGCALSLSMGFGGMNTAICLRRL